jgi:very-short-patch-repair endonuclease
MTPQRAADTIARRQHGVLSRSQARGAGLSEKAIQVRLDSGRWIRLAPGIYATASSASTWERQLTAALLSRPGAVAAGSSAAVLHGFDGFQKGMPQILCGPDANARLALGRVIRVSDFDQVVTTRIRGFEATSVAETLWTVATSMHSLRLQDLVDQQVSMGSTTPRQLLDVLSRLQGTRQRGLRSFRNAVMAIDPSSPAVATNVLEAVLYRLLRHPTIPSVSRQEPFLLQNPARVDAYIPDWDLVAEADGRNWHTRQSDFQRDRHRDNELAARGIVVMRFTYDDLMKRFAESQQRLIAAGRHRRALNAT